MHEPRLQQQCDPIGFDGASFQAKTWTDEQLCVLTAMGILLGIIYGSLLPFDLALSQSGSIAARFGAIQFWAWPRVSRTDIIVNVTTGLPLGFTLMGALHPVRRKIRGLATTILVMAFAAGMATCVELLQTLSDTRLSSWNDVIAQVLGAGLGAAAWPMCGPTVMRWGRNISNEHDPAQLARRLGYLYVPVYLLVELIPPDWQLAGEFRHVQIGRLPLGFCIGSPSHMGSSFVGRLLLAAPIGAMAAGRHTRRSLGLALLTGVLIVVGVQAAQAFTYARYADVTAMLPGALGIVLGVSVTRPRRQATVAIREGSVHWKFLLGFVVWLVVLACEYWYPFDFDLTRSVARDRLSSVPVVPFEAYWPAYSRDPLVGFDEVVKIFLLGVPLGFFAQMTWPVAGKLVGQAGRLVSTGVATIALVLIAVGELFLPWTFPDPTKVIVGSAGAALGVAIGAAFRRRQASIEPSAAHPPETGRVRGGT